MSDVPANLRWIASAPASALHAADAALAGGPLVDRALYDRLAMPIEQLVEAVQHSNQPPQRLLDHLVPLSAGISQPRQLAEVSLAKLMPRSQLDAHVPPLAEALRALWAAWRQAIPDTSEQLKLRSAPLKSLWEARGTGLLIELGMITDPELIATQADVVLVHPVVGGWGRAYLPYNTVVLEAVLADLHPALPETVRLGWLVSQLQCELPKFRGELMAGELMQTAALAMIPAVLAAAEEVELTRCDEPTVRLALDRWVHIDELPTAERTAAALYDWWTTYVQARPPWAVALGALAKMLHGQAAPA